MGQWLAITRAGLVWGLLLALLLSGCGGDAGVGITTPPPPPGPGPEVLGTVRMPNGEVAAAPSMIQRFAGFLVHKAHALFGDVSPVGRNVVVSLSFLRDDDTLQTGLGETFTNDQGVYAGLRLPDGVTEGAPDGRYWVSVGSGSALTRAFVCATSRPMNIDFHSEALVRLVLEKVDAGIPLTNFSPAELCDILDALITLPGFVPGDNSAEINDNATELAGADPGIRALIDKAAGIPTPSPTTTPDITARIAEDAPAGATVIRVEPDDVGPFPRFGIIELNGQVVGYERTGSILLLDEPLEEDAVVGDIVTLISGAVSPTPTTPGVEPTATPTTPGVVRTPTPTRTADQTPPPTIPPTATPTGVNINVGIGIVDDEDEARVDVLLISGGESVGGMQNDILFDNRAVSLTSAASCRINPEIGILQSGCQEDPIVGPCKNLSGTLKNCGAQPKPDGCPEEAGAETSLMRVIVAATAFPNKNDIPDGVLYTCTFGAQDIGRLPAVLKNNNIVVSSPVGERIEDVGGGDGLVTLAAALAAAADAGATTLELEAGDADRFPASGAISTGPQVLGFTRSGAFLTLDTPLANALPAGFQVLLVPGQPQVTPTPTPTASLPPTDTPVPTNTPQPTPTSGGEVPLLSIGSVSGSAGAQVSVPLSLQKRGPDIVTIAPLVFDFDDSVLSFVDCSSQVVGKAVEAALPEPGRVSLVMSGGLGVIPDGMIASCRFAIAAGAPAGASVLDFVRAGMSDAGLNDYEAEGTNGAVTVSAATAPVVNIGMTSGVAGGQAVVPLSLTKNGPAIVTIAPLVFDFDDAVLSFVSCTSQAGGKSVDAGVPQAGRVSLVMSGGLSVIPDGLIATCTFNITAGAAAGTSVLEFVQAGMADADLNDFAAQGNDGSVTISEAVRPVISIGTRSSVPGGQATVPLSLTKNGPDIVTIAPLVFDFDDAVLEFVGCVPEIDGKDVSAVSPEAGRVSLVMSGGLDVIPDGEIAACTFTVAASAPAGQSTLTFVEAGMSDADLNDVEADGSNGTVSVSSPSGPVVAIGTASGEAGSEVTVALSLTKNGPDVVTIAPLVFDFDDAALDFGTCTSTVAGKGVAAEMPSAGRISLVMSGGLDPLPDGPIIECTFDIDAGAAPGARALPFVSAGMADADLNEFAAAGADGAVAVQ